MVLLYLTQPTLLVSLNNRFYDTFLGFLPPGESSDVPVIVDLDDRSLDRYGQWPWPRYRVALLLEKIRLLGAAAVGIDIIFAEPDRTSLGQLQEDVDRDLGLRLDLSEAALEATDNDRILADELARGPYVLSYEFTFGARGGGGGDCPLHPLNLARLERRPGVEGFPFFTADGVICNLESLARAAASSGFFNATADRDGILRRVPLVIRYAGGYYPSLALASLNKLRGPGGILLESSPSGNVLRFDGKRIPVDNRGNLLLRYRGGPGRFSYLSAASVLDDSLPPGRFEGKIVFLGTTAAGLHEIRTTPLQSTHPGAEIHATVVDNILTGDILSRPAYLRLFEVLLIIFVGGGASLLLGRVRAGWGLLATAAGAVLILAFTKWLMAAGSVYFSPLAPLLTLGTVFPVLESFKYLEEEKKVRERTREFTLAQEAIIQTMASLAETRDKDTGGHILRTQHYVLALARRLSREPRYRGELTEDRVDMLFKVAPLHDVGKVGVRDSVLLKAGHLTAEEFEEMKKHTTYASETLLTAEKHLGGNAFLAMAREIAETHQEKWDGSGYPRGLKGEEIPLSGRIMAVADVYDALVSRRNYKDAVSHEEATAILAEGRGTHFDPAVIEAFIDIGDQFLDIARRYADSAA
jgi:HD-GYP domain-containing protein (c-di-GMP phosphodiesterase class II)